MQNVVIKGKDSNGLPVSNQGATPYRHVWIQSKLHEGKQIWWAYVAITKEEEKMLGVNNWAYWLYGSEDPRAAAYVSMKFNENREANLQSLVGRTIPKEVDSICWGDDIEIPDFQFDCLPSFAKSKKRGSDRAKAVVAKIDRPIKKARRGIGSY